MMFSLFASTPAPFFLILLCLAAYGLRQRVLARCWQISCQHQNKLILSALFLEQGIFKLLFQLKINKIAFCKNENSYTYPFSLKTASKDEEKEDNTQTSTKEELSLG